MIDFMVEGKHKQKDCCYCYCYCYYYYYYINISTAWERFNGDQRTNRSCGIGRGKSGRNFPHEFHPHRELPVAREGEEL